MHCDPSQLVLYSLSTTTEPAQRSQMWCSRPVNFSHQPTTGRYTSEASNSNFVRIKLRPLPRIEVSQIIGYVVRHTASCLGKNLTTLAVRGSTPRIRMEPGARFFGFLPAFVASTWLIQPQKPFRGAKEPRSVSCEWLTLAFTPTLDSEQS